MAAKSRYIIDIDKHNLRAQSSEAQKVMWYVLMVIEALLIVRFFLQLLEVLPSNLFTGLLYSLSEYLLVPFTILFSNSATGLINWVIVIGALFYLLLYVGIRRFLDRGTTFSRIEAAREISKRKYGWYE